MRKTRLRPGFSFSGSAGRWPAFLGVAGQRPALPDREQQKSAGVNSFAQIKKDLKPYMGQ